ncbi:MAG: signal peptidase I [Blautia sp.]|nr:signal peptidase I [Blautia sp.]
MQLPVLHRKTAQRDRRRANLRPGPIHEVKKEKRGEGVRQMEGRAKKVDMPTLEQLQKEVDRVHYRRDFSRVMINTIYSLVVVAAIAVLVAVLLLPILRIYGHSMNDTLDEGDIVVSLKGSDFKTGDIVAFYYNNKILIKRVIGQAGDWVDIDQDGNVYVNGNLIDEPYLQEKAFGECNIELPYQVPESKVFVMGDNRSVSVDSRNTAVGCVAEEQIVGKVVYRLWPLKDFGSLK